MVEILVKGRGGKTAVVPLPHDRPLVIGRKGRLRIDDRQISRQHVRVVHRDDAWYVEDLGSRNGTYINQVRVIRTERVQPGDTIRIGNTSMVVRQAAPQGVGAPPTVIAQRRPHPIAIPDHASNGGTSLALSSADGNLSGGDAASRRWGPIVLVATSLALLISILFNAISHARTMSALRSLESAAQRRAEQRDLDLITALRSDLRKPPTGLTDLTATLDRAAQRVDEATRASEARDSRQISELQRTTSEELAEIRQTLDGLSKRLEASPPPAPALAAVVQGKIDAEMAAAQPGAGLLPVVKSPVEHTITAKHERAPEVVFVIDASRGLAGALQQALAQVRLARTELAPDQRSCVLVARASGVVEIADDDSSVVPAELDAEHPADQPPVTRALAAALRLNPRTLHVFTDHPGDGAGRLREFLKSGAAGATPVNVTHFYTREYREDLKALARDHGGIYAFVGQG